MLKSIKYCSECKGRKTHHDDICQVCKDKKIEKEEKYWCSLDIEGKLEYLRKNQQKLMKKTKGLSVLGRIG